MDVGVSHVWSSFSWDQPQSTLLSNPWYQEKDDLEKYTSQPIANDNRTTSEAK